MGLSSKYSSNVFDVIFLVKNLSSSSIVCIFDSMISFFEVRLLVYQACSFLFEKTLFRFASDL